MKNKKIGLINNSGHKEYSEEEFRDWVNDMLSGLRQDLKCYKKQCRGRPTINNYSDYAEGFFIAKFIEWFIKNHFD